MKGRRSIPASTAPRIRILSGSAIAIGPGKADLLRAIDETGSISAAARRMHMSYRRAWLLVHTMNDCFRSPLVEAEKGGNKGGGASLTVTGRRVLAEYGEVAQLVAVRFGPYFERDAPHATSRGGIFSAVHRRSHRIGDYGRIGQSARSSKSTEVIIGVEDEG